MPNALNYGPPVTTVEARFAAEYLVDLNGTQAMLRVRPQLTRQSAAVQASRLLQRERVVRHIRQLQAERAKRLEVTGDDVLARLWRIATADPRELVSVHVDPCPHCHRDLSLDHGAAARPNPSCTECWGDGRPRLVLRDTTTLSDEGAALYAGARSTRYGVEILLNSQLKALALVGQHLGMFATGGSGRADSPHDADPIQSLVEELAARHGDRLAPAAPPNPRPQWRQASPTSQPRKKANRS